MSPSKRVSIALRKAARIEDAAVRAQVRLLQELRRAVLGALGDASGFRIFHLSQLLTAIDQEIRQRQPRAEAAAQGAAQDAFLAATRMVDDMVSVVGRTGLQGFSSQPLDAAISITTDQVRSVWSELGTRLKSEVRRAALGVTDPFEAIRNLARIIRNPKTFGRVETRAEAIIRTEVLRTYSLATQRRMEESNERLGGGLKKYWLTAEDSRVRPDHASAGKAYGLKGSPGPIAIDRAYIVGDERLMFPRDPVASAAQTVNCRCVSVPFVDDVAVAITLPKTA